MFGPKNIKKELARHPINVQEKIMKEAIMGMTLKQQLNILEILNEDTNQSQFTFAKYMEILSKNRVYVVKIIRSFNNHCIVVQLCYSKNNQKEPLFFCLFCFVDGKVSLKPVSGYVKGFFAGHDLNTYIKFCKNIIRFWSRNIAKKWCWTEHEKNENLEIFLMDNLMYDYFRILAII